MTSEQIPVRKPDVIVTVLRANYKKIIKCLRRKGRLANVPADEVTVVTRPSSDNRLEILQLSDHSTELLRLCDGKQSVSEIGERFREYAPQVNGVSGVKASVLGLEILRQQGLLVLTSGSGVVPEQQHETFAYQTA